MDLLPVSATVWEIPQRRGMLVPGRVYASDELVVQAADEQALQQVVNVAHLPGIVDASMAMPDIHWGYGFPIGGVAATAVESGGVVSPGGVGFDICCGVRLLRSDLAAGDFHRRSSRLMDQLSRRIPRGLGKGFVAAGAILGDVLERGAAAAVDAGYGEPADLDRCEETGTSAGATPGALSPAAVDRGAFQLGSLGGGNHFLEVQVVDQVLDTSAAAAFGLAEGTVTVMIHCGSRGLGHQTCQDQLRVMGPAMRRHGLQVPDRQLACVPVRSEEGARYLGVMAAAANFAWANRHILAHEARQAFAAVFGSASGGMDLVFDVAHNLAKLERHRVGDAELELCVHRKGATRAFGPGHPDLPAELRSVGQPVLVPGSMGTASWVLCGVAGNPAFASAAHGAGRVMSRKEARRRSRGEAVRHGLERAGVAVRPANLKLLSEEAPYAYKDVDVVAEVCATAGLATLVARLRPLGVVKG